MLKKDDGCIAILFSKIKPLCFLKSKVYYIFHMYMYEISSDG